MNPFTIYKQTIIFRYQMYSSSKRKGKRMKKNLVSITENPIALLVLHPRFTILVICKKKNMVPIIQNKIQTAFSVNKGT